MLTQIQLEQKMYSFGRARADRVMANNEDGGRANNNPYASVIYRRFVLPLAEAIKLDLDNKKPGRAKAHVSLLAPLDPEAVAFMTVRGLICCLLSHSDDHSSRNAVSIIGRVCHQELILKMFENINPALFHTLTHDLDRRMSKDETHRMRVFKREAKQAGITFPEWGNAGRNQVGAYLLNQLAILGLVETRRTFEKSRAGIEVHIAPDILRLIETIKGMTKETMPYFLPCVEQPVDWTAIDEGGFHTDEMRRMHPYCVSARGAWSDVQRAGIDIPLRAINALQRVPWAISGRMLEAIKNVSRFHDMEEILSQAELPAPAKPLFLEDGVKEPDMTPEQVMEFKLWKSARREWYTEGKLRGHKAARMVTALKVAEEFLEYPAIYFVYFADFRGRLYVQTTGVSPQGSDMQKALLRFSKGKPLDSTDAEMWFMCHGANKWGYDKVSLDDRVQWVKEHHKLILSFAENPADSAGWMGADKPLQFLAWCQEYADWFASPHTFLSYLPIGMDGSCNGLQNFSAMLRDEVGGAAVNLIPSSLPKDIYQRVADVTAHLLRKSGPDDCGFRDRWLTHGINRTLVKRSVMTQPYGSTRFSCASFIVEDYMRLGKSTEFAKDEYAKAANYLSHFVWQAISEVVVKAREAMDWLQASASKIIKGGKDEITWVTPSGFPVVQRYQRMNSHRIRTSLCGNAFLRLNVEVDEADASKHRNGIAPNFIHSYDASHLQLTVVAAAAEGFDLAMIHDDYATHAADTPRLATLIRETFVGMYEGSSPLDALAAAYDLPEPPQCGTLDIRQVLQSTYFFA